MPGEGTAKPDAPEEVDEAAQAFEALRVEVSALRATIDAACAAPDYSPTLAALSQGLTAVEARLGAIERHTGAGTAAEVAQREIRRVYDAALHPARLDLERATREVLDAGSVLAAASGGLRTARRRSHDLIWAGVCGLVIGLLTGVILTLLVRGDVH